MDISEYETILNVIQLLKNTTPHVDNGPKTNIESAIRQLEKIME